MEQVQKEFEWFLNPLKNHYFDFEGRVTRQAFWMFTLWSIIIYIGLSIIAEPAAMLFSLATLLPSLGLGARRLHDIGMSGWWQLIWFIPILGWIAIIVLLAKQGIAGPNEYGADPRVAAGAPTPMPSAPVAAATPEIPSSSQNGTDPSAQ
jgi:uncharacterized membrane protein YhaH (DUF805 family)